MATIKCYECECGEDFYEDDTECCNCGAPVDQSKFKEEPLVEIIEQSEVELVSLPLLNLNSEQKHIIEHTISNGTYCGDSPDMDALVKLGLMQYMGKKSFVPDGYYNVTRAGREAVS